MNPSDPLNITPKTQNLNWLASTNNSVNKQSNVALQNNLERMVNKSATKKTPQVAPIPLITLNGPDKFHVQSEGDPDLLNLIPNKKRPGKEELFGSTIRQSSASTILSNNPARIKSVVDPRKESIMLLPKEGESAMNVMSVSNKNIKRNDSGMIRSSSNSKEKNLKPERSTSKANISEDQSAMKQKSKIKNVSVRKVKSDESVLNNNKNRKKDHRRSTKNLDKKNRRQVGFRFC